MVTANTTQDRVIHLISGICRIPHSSIHPFTSLKDDLYLDTVDMLLLIAAIENDFNVYLTEEEANSIVTVRDASYYIQHHAA